MAEEYKKISDLTEMLASDINSSTKMVVTTGELKDSRNLNISDLVVGNLSTDSDYRALSSSMGKKLNDEKASIANPVFTGTVGGVTKSMVGLGNVDNTSDINKPVSQAVQSALDSKAPTNSPTFTGTTNFEGDVQVSENVIVDGNVRAYKSIVDNWLQFGSGARVKIQTGMNGGTPVYREFPATDLASSDLNGTNYVMVYGVGTPTENADELLAAYNEAKKMPRYLGIIGYGTVATVYKGQAYTIGGPGNTILSKADYTGIIQYQPDGDTENITLDIAKSIRTTVIVAPGEYNFGESVVFNINAPCIDVKSLTGKRDVIINSVNVSSDLVYVSGINCGTGQFKVSTDYSDYIIENCEGGNDSFGYIKAKGTFIDCIGGNNSFGTYGEVSGKFIRCVGGNDSFGKGGVLTGYFEDCKGGDYSFGSGGTIEAPGTFNNCTAGNSSFGYGGIAAGILINCKLTAGTFQTPPGEGKIYNCIDGNGNLINTPLPIFADNVAAASLAVGTMYRTSTGVQMIKF